MAPFLIFVVLMLLTLCKNHGWGLEHNLFGRQSFIFFYKIKFDKKIFFSKINFR